MTTNEIKLIGTRRHHIIHAKSILLGFATFILPKELVVWNPQAVEDRGRDARHHPGVRSFDDGTWLVEVIVKLPRDTNKVYMDLPSKPYTGHDGRRIYLVSVSPWVRETMLRRVKEGMPILPGDYGEQADDRPGQGL